MTDSRPLIMVSNDDGVHAPGLRHLIDSVKEFGDVIAVAPDAPRSGQASAITVDTPLRITEHDDIDGAKVYSVNGTPVDCVKLGLHAIMPRKPDLMLSGVNHGSNSGNSVIYSGTMGVAMEACMVGVPAVGFSLLHHSIAADFTHTTPYIIDIVRAVLQKGLPADVCLNVNIPAKCVPLGIKVVRAARGYWTEEYKEYSDPAGRPFYMLTGHFHNEEPDNDATDEYWLARKYVSVVPVRPDQTDTAAISTVREILCL
ncbi:MAG: 5'/3'-nucleotidase SurE [Paramuribaculum sp.]|nr:5'/3'-nucleotidase SurE [Paramuribaculum sp.]